MAVKRYIFVTYVDVILVSVQLYFRPMPIRPVGCCSPLLMKLNCQNMCSIIAGASGIQSVSCQWTHCGCERHCVQVKTTFTFVCTL